MTSEESMFLSNIAIVNANVARAMIRLEGMKAENLQRLNNGESLAYVERQFEELIRDEEIGYNDVLGILRRGF